MNNLVIEFINGSKYVLIDILEYDNIKYFLLTKLNDSNIDNCFDIVRYNTNSNTFEPIDDEMLYDTIKNIFDNRLERHRIELNNMPKMIELKVINIDGFNYTLENTDGEIRVKNIELYSNIKLEVNDYVWMNENTYRESNIYQYGPVYNDKDEIIKIIKNDKFYYLQRYYG